VRLTLAEETTDRSLERRWDLTDAEQVMAYPLRPSKEFVPVDLRIWWQKSDGGRREEALRGHAWPAKDQDRDRTFASWDADGGKCPSAMPQWVRDLAAVVRTDLESNRASKHAGTDFWGYGNHRSWALEDAPLVTDRKGIEFVPVELDVWHSFYPDPATRPDRVHRYSVYAHSAGRSDRMSVQWGGTAARHDPLMPDWVREFVDAQYADLAAAGRASTTERDDAEPAIPMHGTAGG
jgi:hypothetical protein